MNSNIAHESEQLILLCVTQRCPINHYQKTRKSDFMLHMCILMFSSHLEKKAEEENEEETRKVKVL